MLQITVFELNKNIGYSQIYNSNSINEDFDGDVSLKDAKKTDIAPGSYKVSELAEILKQKTYRYVIVEADKNTMKFKMHVRQGIIRFDTKSQIEALLSFIKQVHPYGKNRAKSIHILVDVMVLILLIVTLILNQLFYIVYI